MLMQLHGRGSSSTTAVRAGCVVKDEEHDSGSHWQRGCRLGGRATLHGHLAERVADTAVCRRACEAAQQYHEARAARDRLRELRTQQAEVVLSNVHLRHAHELALVRSSLLAQRERHEAECADRAPRMLAPVATAALP